MSRTRVRLAVSPLVPPSLLSRALLALILLACAPAVALAQGIAYVDMERVLQESAMGQAAQQRLEQRFGERQQPFAEEELAIRRMQAQLDRDKPLMSAAQVERTEREIKERIERLEQDFEGVQREVMQAQQEEGRRLIEPARQAVIAVAKEKKLTLVFEASQLNAIYIDEAAEITDAVIAAMNARNR